MDAVNYAGSRNRGRTIDGTSKIESRKSIFSRFMNGLMESRRREARRVIATYAHLLAQDDTPERPRREN
jgi:hypothetical protein